MVVHGRNRGAHRARGAGRRWMAGGVVAALACAGAVVAGLDSAQAVQAPGHDVALWTPGNAWTYAQTLNYDDGTGNKVTINENATYTVTGLTTFAGQPAYQLSIAGSVTGGSGSANGTSLSISSGSVSGTEYRRRSDLALLQQQQRQDIKGKAAGLVGVSASIDLTLTPQPAWRTLDFPLNAGDSWQENESIAYTGSFSYDAGSFGNGNGPFDGTFPFVAPATVSAQTVNVPIGSVATDFVASSSPDGASVENQWWSPTHRNVAKDYLKVPLDGATLTVDRNLASVSLPAPPNSIGATITPSLTCAGATVSVAGTLGTNAAGVPVTVSLDRSAVTPGAAQTVSTTTGANGTWSAALTAPADADGYGKNGARADWGVLVSAPSANAYDVATLVVTPQDCTTLAYTGATSGPQGGTATVSARLTDLATPANAANRPITFALGGGASVVAATDASGVATATLPVGGPPRATTITATSPAAPDLVAATASAAFQVTVAPTSTSVVANPMTVQQGDPVSFTAGVTPGVSLPSSPTGTVQFAIDGLNLGGPQPLSGGTATSPSISSLGLGTHTVTATYGGDANYGTSAGTSTFRVRVPLLASTVTLAVDPATSVYGQGVDLTATVAPRTGTGHPTGDVTFTDGTTALGTAAVVSTADGDVATLRVTSLPTGSHQIVANYLGDEVYNGGTSTAVNQTVLQAATTTTVTSSAGPTVTGQSVDVTAAVAAVAPGAGTPTGTAQLRVDGVAVGSPVALSGGAAAFPPLTDLSAGTHTLAVTYSGDGNFAGSTGSRSQSVDRAQTTTRVTTSPSPSAEDQAVTVTAAVAAVAPGSGSPTGTVTFTADGDPIGAGTLSSGPSGSSASITVATLSVGSHSIVATYAGDADYVGSTSEPASQTVVSGAQTVATSTTLTSSLDPSTFGQLIAFTATVTAEDGTPAGAVQFSVDGVDLGDPVPLSAGGTATSPTLASPHPGDHTVIAAFVPAAGFAASGATLVQTVADAAVDLALTSSDDASGYGQEVRFTATVASRQIGTGTPTGLVQFRVDDRPLGAALPLDEDGSATSPAIGSLTPGPHSVTAVYGGDVDFVGAVTTITQTVDVIATTTALEAGASSLTYGSPVTLTATVTPATTALGVPPGSVDFTDGDTVLGTAAVSPSGTASVVLPALGAGTHAIVARYGGSAFFGASDSPPASVTVAKQTTSIKADGAVVNLLLGLPLGLLRVRLSTPAGALPGQPVVFAVGGRTVCTVTTDATGTAVCNAQSLLLQLVLSNGYTATYAGTANYVGSSAKAGVIK